MAGPRVLLISNGHGEDVVGDRLARALQERRGDLRIRAMPTVGLGLAYRGGPAVRIGPLASLPADGTTLRSWAAAAGDLRAGLIGVTLAQARDLRAAHADVVVAVGDAWSEFLGLLPRSRVRVAVQTLVSARMAAAPAPGLAAFRQRFTAAERLLLRRAYRRVYVRDEASARWLHERGVPAAVALGNPMMDGLDAEPLGSTGAGPRIAALPGSRASAAACLSVMMRALRRLPAGEVAVAWSREEDPPPDGWTECASPFAARAWRHGDVRLHLVRDRFPAVLAWADLALGTTGTAQEQAAGRGLPVVSFPCGAATDSFLANQRHLLGDALEVVAAEPAVVADALVRLMGDPAERRRRGEIGRDRMGSTGGSARIAADLLDRLLRADVGGRKARVDSGEESA